MTRRKKFIFWILLLSIPISAVVVLDRTFAKLATNRILADANNHFFRYDAELGIIHRNNIEFKFRSQEIPGGYVRIATNNLGFRENDATVREKESDFRVIVFGDSHTDGVANNEDTFPNIAEERLRSQNLDVEVINAGVMTYSPYQQLLSFEKFLDLDPDIAVFTFYSGNDYFDLLAKGKPHLSEDVNGDIVRNPPAPKPQESFIQTLSKRSAIIGACANLFKKRAENEKKHEPIQRAVNIDAGMVWQSMQQGYALPGRFEETSRLNEFVVKEIQEIGQRNSIDIIFITLPTSYQIQSQEAQQKFADIEEILGTDANKKIDDRVLADVTRLAGEYKVALVDPTSALTKAAKPVYWQFDQHLNLEGCRIVGESLAEEIANRLTYAVEDDAKRYMRRFRLTDLDDISDSNFLAGVVPGKRLSKGWMSFKKPGERTHDVDCSCESCDGSGRHVHDEIEVFVMLQGKAKMELNGEIHHLRTGDIFVCAPGEDHHLVSDEEEPCLNMALHVSSS